jgi:hypothetical protein
VAVEIRTATQKDAEMFYGGKPLVSMRAYVAVLDGEPIGIGGVCRQDNHMVCFSEMKPEMRKHKKDIVRGYHKIFEIVRMYNTVFAIANRNEKNAKKLITRLGFELVDMNSGGEEVYRWHKRQPQEQG